jgi:hypothetical protein
MVTALKPLGFIALALTVPSVNRRAGCQDPRPAVDVIRA